VVLPLAMGFAVLFVAVTLKPHFLPPIAIMGEGMAMLVQLHPPSEVVPAANVF
jgi:hypothetical protein